MAETGFEMLIFSFGSGFRLESADPTYLATIKAQIDYAHSKHIEVGGYDLICLDRGNPGQPYGEDWSCKGDSGEACFASGWFDKLSYLVHNFINETGLSMLETDGPYGGDKCESHNHSHHDGLEDSVYRQTQLQSAFYSDMRRLNVYVNQPDSYFFQGGSRTGMGYDEQQYSLPRWRDLSVSRMGMYDDLYSYLPTQGWMFLPITDYHAGGEAAAFGNDLRAYEWGLAQYLGAGTAACYRGSRVYKDEPTRTMVTKWISWYKAHRATLIHPIVHIRRADMQSWDGWLHVNPFAYGAGNNTNSNPDVEVGVAMLFNPTTSPLSVTVAIPLYYTGLTTAALVSVDEGPVKAMALGRDYSVQLPLEMAAGSIHTVVFSRPHRG
jgi:hypothetical protein